MKKLMFALACAASFAAMADVTPTQSDFEGITAETSITTTAAAGPWVQSDGDPASVVKTYAGESMATYNGFWGSPLTTAYGLNYLALDTGGGELVRLLDNTGGTTNPVPVTAEAPVYIATLVQFTATDPSPEVEIADDAKLAIWMVGNEEDGYVLKVKAGDHTGSALTSATYDLTNDTVAAFSVSPNTWYRLTVKAVKDILDPALTYGYMYMPAFEIYLDGQLLKNAGGATLTGLSALQNAMSAESYQALSDGKVFPSLQAGSATTTLASVGFQGSGALDDFLMTTAEPNFLTPVTTLDFTLAWSDAAISAVSYAISNNNAEVTGTTAATSGTAITLNSGDTITVTPTFTYPAAYEATYTPDALGKVTALDNAFTFADVGTVTVTVGVNQVALTGLGTSADPYKIGSTQEFNWWKAGLGTTYAANGNYQLTGNIDCDGATGISTVFSGVFDGDNYTISNFTLSDADKYEKWVGFFVHVTDATIQNVKFDVTINDAGNSVCKAIAVGTADGGLCYGWPSCVWYRWPDICGEQRAHYELLHEPC